MYYIYLEKLTIEPAKTVDNTEPNAPVLPPKPGKHMI